MLRIFRDDSGEICEQVGLSGEDASLTSELRSIIYLCSCEQVGLSSEDAKRPSDSKQFIVFLTHTILMMNTSLPLS